MPKMDCLSFSQFVNPKIIAMKKRRDGVYLKINTSIITINFIKFKKSYEELHKKLRKN